MFLVAAIAVVGIAGMIVRPRGSPEWVWAAGAAIALVAVGAVAPAQAWRSIARGADVYAFLVGILALAELARGERVFDWVAGQVVRSAGGSQPRMLALVYLAGVAVTVFLSNDTTVVALTPAVLAALARTNSQPLPYLFACAFVANAASFVLPVSNPANLVMFGSSLPSSVPWLAAFAAPAFAAIALTYISLRLLFRDSLASPLVASGEPVELGARGRLAALLLALSAVALTIAAFTSADIGFTALGAAVTSTFTLGVLSRESARSVVRHIAWQVVPLVAGLFVIVDALDRAGAVDAVRALLLHAQTLGAATGALVAGATMTAASNVFNNLPIALAGGVALQHRSIGPAIVHAALIGIDLGPNLSVTGSLATLLWLIVLRRAGINVTARQFLRTGAIVLTPALLAALLLVG